MNGEDLLVELEKVADQACLKKCGKQMTQECEGKDCAFFNKVNNSYFHLKMGWVGLLEKNLENIKKKEMSLNVERRES